VLQCFCSVLQSVAVCCSALQCVAVCFHNTCCCMTGGVYGDAKNNTESNEAPHFRSQEAVRLFIFWITKNHRM